MRIPNPVYQARRQAVASAQARFLQMLAQPVRIVRDPEQPDWYMVKRGDLDLAGHHSVTQVRQAANLAHIERRLTIANVMLTSLHGPMTSTALFKATMKRLPADIAAQLKEDFGEM